MPLHPPDAENPPRRSNAEVLTDLGDLRDRVCADIGCGDGRLARWLVKRGAVALALDPGADAIGRAALQTGVYAIRAAAERLPLCDASLDLALFMNSLHHVPPGTVACAVEAAARALKPGGRLCAIEPVASGPFFDLAQEVEDETEVRRAAHAALRDPPADLAPTTETHYTAEIVYPEAGAFMRALVAVDPARRERVAALAATLRARFEGLGRAVEKGRAFDQPMRMNLLVKRARPPVPPFGNGRGGARGG